MVQRDVALDAGQLHDRHIMLRSVQNAGAQLTVVWQGEAAKELDGVLAIGGYERNIGAVGRCAAHEAQDFLKRLLAHVPAPRNNINGSNKLRQSSAADWRAVKDPSACSFALSEAQIFVIKCLRRS